MKYKITIRKNKGRCMVATKRIRKGETIDINYVLPVPDREVTKTISYYVWEWENQSAVVLGNISLANHSFEPNAYCQVQNKNQMAFIALRMILPGEEICHNYTWPEWHQPKWYKEELKKCLAKRQSNESENLKKTVKKELKKSRNKTIK